MVWSDYYTTMGRSGTQFLFIVAGLLLIKFTSAQGDRIKFTQCECSCPHLTSFKKETSTQRTTPALVRDAPYIEEDDDDYEHYGSGLSTDFSYLDEIFRSPDAKDPTNPTKDEAPFLQFVSTQSQDQLSTTTQYNYKQKPDEETIKVTTESTRNKFVKGDKGDKGERGLSGIDGAQGSKGEPGTRGLSGQPGYPGRPGEKGEKGSVGPRGYPGTMGPQGYRGAEGPRGGPGSAGPRGNEGPRGPRGETGVAGQKGQRGPQGEPGNVGPPGEPGKDANQRKVAFLARLVEHAGPSTSSSHLVFPQVDFNLGQGYDPSSGSFLVTTEGLYIFHLQAMAMADHIAWLAVHINGKPVAYVWASGYLSGVEQMGTTITIQQLKLGDTVNIIQKASDKPPNYLYAHYTLFAGYLLG